MIDGKYGAVYTPKKLADFVVYLLKSEIESSNNTLIVKKALDPACGEGALLLALKQAFPSTIRYCGIDIDADVTNNISNEYDIYHMDTILPEAWKGKTVDYWKQKIGNVQLVIANPPWSSEKIYDKQRLEEAGFTLISGQYDSYVLFVEFAYQLLQPKGYFAFIIPDSIFDAQNEKLREFLTSNTQIKVIARLGEKIFEGVNRATTVIVCQKEVPDVNSRTICFRLNTSDRKKYLNNKGSLIAFYEEGKHAVWQKRFITNDSCNFDVDTRSEEEDLIVRIKAAGASLGHIFQFGRGVEISKSGEITVCELCGAAQGYKKKQLTEGYKLCTVCGKITGVDDKTIRKVIVDSPMSGASKIIVGKDLHRYSCKSTHFIVESIKGINYKNDDLYNAPKLLVRKTGLGIYAAIDYSGVKTSQTVYILRYTNKSTTCPIEYYLALLNSRVVYFYYLKIYGENEWKSHPYLTKQIIFSLPIASYEGSEIDRKIIELAKTLSYSNAYDKAIDEELESLIMEKYGLTERDKKMIISEMNALPNLSSINDMKIKETDLCIDI